MKKPRLILGAQPVKELLRARGRQVSKLMVAGDSNRHGAAISAAEELGIEVETFSRRQLDTLANGGMHQGIAALAAPLELTPLSEVLAAHRLVMALDGVQDPQNFGAVVRSAVGLARAPVVWGENSSAPLTPTTFRASAGAIEHAVLCRVPSLPTALMDALVAGFQVICLDAHADRSLRACQLTEPTVLVLGGEGRGLSKSVKRSATVCARLVTPHTIDSLNASVAAALALYEAQSQLEALPSD